MIIHFDYKIKMKQLLTNVKIFTGINSVGYAIYYYHYYQYIKNDSNRDIYNHI